MKLLFFAEDLSDFDQPEQSEADKFRHMQTKVKSLSHHRAILIPKLNELEELRLAEKLTPALRQQMDVIEKKLKTINAQFKQFNIVVGGSKIANPVAVCELALYVGPPAGYPDLTTTQVKLLKQIQEILPKAGILPLTILYGGRRSHAYSGINFVAVNADHTFAWRKYDPSLGAGQNWVYFAGARKMDYSSGYSPLAPITKPAASMNTSEFVAHPEKYLPSYKK